MSSEDISADILGMQKKDSIDIEPISRGLYTLRDILSKACLILNKPVVRESIFLSFTVDTLKEFYSFYPDMNCEGCSLALEEGQATAAVACCQRIYHTGCLIKLACISGHEESPVVCGCNTVLYIGYSGDYQQPVVQLDVNTFLENEENRAQVKRVIEKSIAAKKARRLLNVILREKRREYKIAVKPHSDSIKALKKETIDAVKATPQWKELSNTLRSYTTCVNKFRREHVLYRRDLLSLLGSTRGIGYRDRPQRILRYLIKVKV